MENRALRWAMPQAATPVQRAGRDAGGGGAEVGRAARGHEVRPDALVVRKGAPLLVAVVPSLTVLGRLGVVGGVPAAAVEWSEGRQPTRGAHTSSTQQEDPLFRPYTNRSVSSHSHP